MWTSLRVGGILAGFAEGMCAGTVLYVRYDLGLEGRPQMEGSQKGPCLFSRFSSKRKHQAFAYLAVLEIGARKVGRVFQVF